jgi:hypothetical protein
MSVPLLATIAFLLQGQTVKKHDDDIIIMQQSTKR